MKIYLKPLLKDFQLEQLGIDEEPILKGLSKKALKSLKSAILEENFSRSAKKALTSNVVIKQGPSSITIESNHPAFNPLIRGRRKGPMEWLKKAVKAIPVITPTGEVVFRKATARSFQNGKWVHPGHPKTHVIDYVRDDLLSYLETQVKKQLKKTIRVRGK